MRTQGTPFYYRRLRWRGLLILLVVFVKFADLSEYGYGVAILSESKYGFSCQGNVLRISLLRAATAPDAEQDQGSSCAMMIDAGMLLTVQLLLFSTQASMNSRGLYYPTVDTSSNRTSPSRLISSTLRYTVSRGALFQLTNDTRGSPYVMV